MKSSLYDMNGKIIEAKESVSNGQNFKIQFDISALAAGNYMLIVSFASEDNAAQVSKAAYKIEKNSN